MRLATSQCWMRIGILTILTYGFLAFASTIGVDGIIYPEANWNGKIFVPTGRTIFSCDQQELLCRAWKAWEGF